LCTLHMETNGRLTCWIVVIVVAGKCAI
jgi:hypothetical protein